MWIYQRVTQACHIYMNLSTWDHLGGGGHPTSLITSSGNWLVTHSSTVLLSISILHFPMSIGKNVLNLPSASGTQKWFARQSTIDGWFSEAETSIYHSWLVVSISLKNISQLGWLFPIDGKIQKMFQTTNQIIINNHQ